MVKFELHDYKLFQKPYENALEIKVLVLKIVQEIHEVIETFTTRDFLGMSVNKSSNGVDNQIENQEHEELLSSIQNLKEKNAFIRAQYHQRMSAVQNPEAKESEHNLEDETILRVFHQDGADLPVQLYRINLPKNFLDELKKSHGDRLIPLIHKLHASFIVLSEEIVNL